LGCPDPAAHVEQPDKTREVARDVFHLMQRRISLLLSLPMATLDRLSLQSRARGIADETRATSNPV
jgi:arsenate reductase